MVEYDKRTCHYADADKGCTYFDCDDCKYFYKEMNMKDKELTYGEIFEHFLENCEPKLPIEDYRPCISMFGVPDIPYAIVIWLADGTKIIYIDK